MVKGESESKNYAGRVNYGGVKVRKSRSNKVSIGYTVEIGKGEGKGW